MLIGAIILLGSSVVLYIAYILVAGAIIAGVLFNPRVNDSQMARIFEKEYEYLVRIVDYLSEYENGTIWLSPANFDGNSARNRPIRTPEIYEIAKGLGQRGFRHLHFSGGNFHFQRWSTLHIGRGIVFAPNGITEGDGFFVAVTPLNKTHWYIYEAE